MTTVEPLPADAPVRPLWRRRLVWLVLAILLPALTGCWIYSRVTERGRVLAAITSAGGKYHEETRSARIERAVSRLFGHRSRSGDEVFLDGPQFDDAWLAAQHDLRSLDIRELLIRDTHLSRAAVLRLLERHSLDYLGAPGIPLTDADAEILSRNNNLTHLVLMQTELTDAGLAALEPARLQALSVAGTHISAAGLQAELSTATKLQYLMLDGRQFTPELAAQLAQKKSLTMLALLGPHVTDAHVRLLESMPNLGYIRLEETAVSEDAAAALRTARPAPVTIEVAPPAEVFFKWRTQQSETPSPATPR